MSRTIAESNSALPAEKITICARGRSNSRTLKFLRNLGIASSRFENSPGPFKRSRETGWFEPILRSRGGDIQGLGDLVRATLRRIGRNDLDDEVLCSDRVADRVEREGAGDALVVLESTNGIRHSRARG